MNAEYNQQIIIFVYFDVFKLTDEWVSYELLKCIYYKIIIITKLSYKNIKHF